MRTNEKMDEWMRLASKRKTDQNEKMEMDETGEANKTLGKENLDWHQNDKLIFINVNLEGLKQDKVKIMFDEKSIDITLRDRKYNLKLDLANPVLPKFCIYKVVPSRLEIKMKKDVHRTSKNNAWWKALCKDGSMPGDPKPSDTVDDMTELKEALPKEQNIDMDTVPEVHGEINVAAKEPSKVVIPKITHDWYQTETYVVIEIRAKKLKDDQVNVGFSSASLDISIKFPETVSTDTSNYKLNLNLSNCIIPDQCSYKILSTKVEVKLKKNEGVRWSALEGAPSIPTADVVAQRPPSYQTRKGGKDWDNIDNFLENELEYLKENQDAGDVFSMIYKDADENTRKAMNKSFQESGGTVLSTNWDDISKKKTEFQGE